MLLVLVLVRLLLLLLLLLLVLTLPGVRRGPQQHWGRRARRGESGGGILFGPKRRQWRAAQLLHHLRLHRCRELHLQRQHGQGRCVLLQRQQVVVVRALLLLFVLPLLLLHAYPLFFFPPLTFVFALTLLLQLLCLKSVAIRLHTMARNA